MAFTLKHHLVTHSRVSTVLVMIFICFEILVLFIVCKNIESDSRIIFEISFLKLCELSENGSIILFNQVVNLILFN